AFLPEKVLTALATKARFTTIDDLIGGGWSPTHAKKHGTDVLDLLRGYDTLYREYADAEKEEHARLRKEETLANRNQKKIAAAALKSPRKGVTRSHAASLHGRNGLGFSKRISLLHCPPFPLFHIHQHPTTPVRSTAHQMFSHQTHTQPSPVQHSSPAAPIPGPWTHTTTILIWLRGGLPGKEDAKRIQGFTNQWGIYNKYPSFIDKRRYHIVRDIKIGMRISIASPRQMGKVDRHQPATLSALSNITVDGVPDKTVGKRPAERSVCVIRRRGIINSRRGVFSEYDGNTQRGFSSECNGKSASESATKSRTSQDKQVFNTERQNNVRLQRKPRENGSSEAVILGIKIWLRGGLPGKEDAKRIQGFTNQWGIYNKYPSFIDKEDITLPEVKVERRPSMGAKPLIQTAGRIRAHQSGRRLPVTATKSLSRKSRQSHPACTASLVAFERSFGTTLLGTALTGPAPASLQLP
ncbi:hypothetical protein B0H14DRAFT_2618312, partial [Mycena olivaceomarginata]